MNIKGPDFFFFFKYRKYRMNLTLQVDTALFTVKGPSTKMLGICLFRCISCAVLCHAAFVFNSHSRAFCLSVLERYLYHLLLTINLRGNLSFLCSIHVFILTNDDMNYVCSTVIIVLKYRWIMFTYFWNNVQVCFRRAEQNAGVPFGQIAKRKCYCNYYCIPVPCLWAVRFCLMRLVQ